MINEESRIEEPGTKNITQMLTMERLCRRKKTVVDTVTRGVGGSWISLNDEVKSD